MYTYRQALNQANKLLRRNNKEASAAKLLLLHFSDLEPQDLYLKFDEEMSDLTYNNFIEGLDKHINQNLPVQHIIGYVYFYGYKFIVNSEVLIPRFETEELVVNVLMLYDEYFKGRKIHLVDIGTGSGCLAISLKNEEPMNFNVVATDISESALNVARTNAKNNDSIVEFLQGDMLNPLIWRRFDILVSNPPYIPTQETVDSIIIDNEPHIALFGGDDGLKFYREIISESNKILKDQSIIAFEHGYDKAEQIRNLAKEYYPNARIFTLKDMQGLDRMSFIINGFNEL